jgi:hypothetical protein
MSALQLEKQLFAIQDMSKPLHSNRTALKGFLEKQVGFWVQDAGYDPQVIEMIVDELIPLMGQITHSNVRNHKSTFDSIISDYIGADVEISWVVDER